MIESATKWSRETLERLRGRGGDSRFGAPTLALAGLAGAVGQFFLDPRSGRRRRAAVVERIVSLIPRRGGGDEKPTLDDPVLEAEVESAIFRDPEAPRGAVSVSVANGVVYLRGELGSRDRIEELAASARAVKGVGGVVNLLHFPGDEARSNQNGHSRGKAKRQAAIRSK
jgi:hypothetical protein